MSVIAARAVVEAVLNFSRPLWRVLSVSRKYYRLFSYKAVIAPLVKTTKRTPAGYSPKAVQARLRRVHKMWLARVDELVARGLWYPCPYDNLTTLQLTLVRLINCRPTCCWLKGNRRLGGDLPTKIRPCGRSYFCPFCAARRASNLSRRVKYGCHLYGKNTPKKYELAYRELQLIVPVVGFKQHTADDFVLRRNLSVFLHSLNLAQSALRQSTKKASRKTLGSLSTVVINTTDDSFVISVRQLFLAPKGNRNPWAKLRGAKTMKLMRAEISSRSGVFNLLAQFAAYPEGLLRGYPEFTAVILNARHARRLMSATGVFKRKELRRAQKTQIESQTPKQNSNAANSGAANGIFM